jgi:predicted esterase
MDPTLSLPRILCLHGGGTNARIFRMQCRILERTLRSHFRLVYAEAPLSAQPGSDVTAAYKDYGPFKAWLRVHTKDPLLPEHQIVNGIKDSISTAQKADDKLGATGEWVGLLGFSQGAHLAASILANQQVAHNGTDPIYRFAILLAGRGPLRWLNPALPKPAGFIDAMQCTTGQELVVDSIECRVKIPTVHVHGMVDPNLELHRLLLYRHCDWRCTTLVEWEGDHRVPIKAKDVIPVVQEIFNVAQRTGVIGRLSWERDL